jgi:glyoxylase-like metal-dependent hydrolase (beta-lactamase superfamily II)
MRQKFYGEERENMNYQIYPIYLGGVDVDISTIIYRHPIGEQIKIVMGAFVLKDEKGEFILIDSGAPSAREIKEKGYGFRLMADSVEYIDEIKKLGVEPEKVGLIILTHLHWDHAWNVEYFPNAKFLVHRLELEHAVHPYKNSLKSYAMIKATGGPNWIKGLLQMEVIEEDSVEIRTGLRTILTPGHTPGSMTVLVDTKDGVYSLVSDFAMNMRNYTEGIPTGSIQSIADWYASYKKIAASKTILLPTHDPVTYDKKVYG